jgi:hypothetical protein
MTSRALLTLRPTSTSFASVVASPNTWWHVSGIEREGRKMTVKTREDVSRPPVNSVGIGPNTH